ncbi:MAG: UDP-4-amino-4,6-dideoxy-N-acetyl-beta-L-altrosamine transaminase [Planctomycetes bacterium]|nr:UDP-4-amino-4,6-dideoxy-N-acetyl-beta-L-altrosamine transaminase [Planctomycetota bacterium]
MQPDDPTRPADRFLVFGAPQVGDAEIQEVVATLESGWWGTGPRAARFEKAFRDYKGASQAVALGSCTAALHLSLLAARLEPDAEVITTPMTFCATVNAIIHSGATPVLADVDPRTMNIDPAEIERRITDKTRAIVPVHFAGRACEMDALSAICRKHDLVMIEDCAHAIETEFEGRKAGTIGEFGCFSFYVTKSVATGEGGMVLTSGEEEADRIRRLALHGMTKDAWKRFGDEGHRHYFVVEAGFKYNMMDLQAALGLHQLKRVEDNWLRREEVWRQYDAALASLPLELPVPPASNTRHGYHLYTVLIDEAECGITRDAFLDGMTHEGIGTGVQYLSIPEHPYYRDRYGWSANDWPAARRIGRQTVSLPLSSSLTDGDVADVVTAVHRVLDRGH